MSTASAQEKIDTCSNMISGRVMDMQNHQPIPFVVVRIEGENKSTLTNEKGYFQFKGLCKSQQNLILSCVGFCDTVCYHYHHQHGSIYPLYMKVKVNMLDDVIINVERKKEVGIRSLNQEVVGRSAIEEQPNLSLAQAIGAIDGVTMLNTGNNVQLPIIHGLYGNRILILNNGFKQGFQNWGLDHAAEIDISNADRITVVKGASSIRYGADAMSGAIIVDNDPMLINNPITANVGSGYQTNGRGYFATANVKQGFNNWSYYAGGRLNTNGDQHTPDYNLTNSGKKEKSASAGVRYHLHQWDFKVQYSYIDQNLALLRSSVAESGNLLSRSINSDKPLFIKPFSYQIKAPNQITQHQLASVEANWLYNDHNKITLKYAKQWNDRQEYDIRRNIDKPIIDVSLHTNDVQLDWSHSAWLNKVEGMAGVQYFQQRNTNIFGTGNTPLIPNYITNRLSAFITENYKINKHLFEIGARVDVENNQVAGRTANQTEFADNYLFKNISWAIGYVLQYSEQSKLSFNIGSAWRAPNMAELYSFGQHGFITTFGLLRYNYNEAQQLQTDRVVTIYEANIQPEKSIKFISDWSTETDKSKIVITVYAHYIKNFIYSRPIAVLGTVRGPMPAFGYQQTDAAFVGSDISWLYKWTQKLESKTSVSAIWSRNISKSETLIFQPPINANLNLSYHIPRLWKLSNGKFHCNNSYTFRQFQAPQTYAVDDLINGTIKPNETTKIFDFKSAPNGYYLMNIGMSYEYKNLRMSIFANNVLNNNYRNYLNQMRYFADEPGRNIMISLNYKFTNKSKTNENN